MVKEKKFPKSVVVFGRKIRVIEQDLVEKGLLGQYDDERKVILIEKNQEMDQKWSTLRHEKLHAALNIGGVAGVLSSEHEEGVVVCIENAWEDLI